jgi:hypothetical protein
MTKTWNRLAVSFSDSSIGTVFLIVSPNVALAAAGVVPSLVKSPSPVA